MYGSGRNAQQPGNVTHTATLLEESDEFSICTGPMGFIDILFHESFLTKGAFEALSALDAAIFNAFSSTGWTAMLFHPQMWYTRTTIQFFKAV